MSMFASDPVAGREGDPLAEGRSLITALIIVNLTGALTG